MYKKPAYDIKTSGIYLFKTKNKEYIIKSYLFERDNDTEDGLEIQDELRDELGSIVFKNSAWNRLSKGNTIIAKSNIGNIQGKLTRLDDINNSEKYEGGGNIGNMPKVKLSIINKIKKLSNRIIEIDKLNLGNEDDIYSYSGNLSFKERRKLFNELRKIESELTTITDELSKTQCQSIDSESFQALNCGDDYGYEDEYEGGGMIDLFEDYDNIPDKVNNILEKYDMEDQDYESLEAIKKRVEKVGYTFDFGLDAQPYGLRPVNVKLDQLEGYEDEYKQGGIMIKGKGSRAKNAYNKEVDLYKWFIVDLEKKIAITGNEYKEDAIDALSDYDGDKNFKIVSKSQLKKLGVDDPTSEWKYAKGGWLKDHNYVNKSENYETRYSKDKPHRSGYKKFAGGGEIEGKIEDLQAVVDGDFPQFAKDKAKSEIERLTKELHESKESKSEEKAEEKIESDIKKHIDSLKLSKFVQDASYILSADEEKIEYRSEDKEGRDKITKQVIEAINNADEKTRNIYLEELGFKSKESKSEEKADKISKSEPEVKYKKGTTLYLKDSFQSHQKGTELEVKYDFIPEYDDEINVRTTEGMIKATFKISPEKVTTEDETRKQHKFKVGDSVVFLEGKNDDFYIVDRLLPFSKRFISYEVVIKKPNSNSEYIESEKNLKIYEGEAKPAPAKKGRKPRVSKPTEKILKPSKEIVDYFKEHGKKEAYLYNNRIGFNKGMQSSDQYDFNHDWISKQSEETKKVSHKDLLAKAKAKKSKATPSNAPSKGHKRSEALDRKRSAKPLGRRVSDSGNVYYENRLNRADIDKDDKFNKGGEIESNPFKTKRGCW